MKHGVAAALAIGGVVLSGCSTTGVDPIFIEGRAVASAGDSVIAFTIRGQPDVVVRHRRTGNMRRIGGGALHSPTHVQWHDGQWYVSDVDNGRSVIVVLAPDGTVRRRILAGEHTDTPHQFAVLPDGRIVLEGRRGNLLAIGPDSVSTFALTERSSRTGLLLGAAGGVLHAVPDQYLTLYNEFGSIRWRQEWPWAATAFVSDLALDPHGRIHVIAGVPRDGTFVVYTLSSQSGEVLLWSTPGPAATFTVERLGDIRPANAGDWTR